MLWEAELLLRAKSLFDGSGSQICVDDDTTMMKGSDHNGRQLHYEFQNKM